MLLCGVEVRVFPLASCCHHDALHDHRLLLFACVVHLVRLLDICRVDRLVFASFSWPALCRLGCHRRSGPHHFRCCFLFACLFVTIVMLCFVDPALSFIAAASCRSGSSRWHSYGSSPAVAAHPLPGHVAVRALRMLVVAFPCSSWPFPCADYFDGK